MAGNTPPLTHETFVRHLPFSQLTWLASTLDIYDLWETLAAKIPLNYNDLLSTLPVQFNPRYTTQNLMAFRRKGSPTRSLLEEWGSVNCEIKHLIRALRNACLFDAANHISSFCTQIPPAQLEQRSLSNDDNETQENVLSIDISGRKDGKSCDEGSNIQQMPEFNFELLRRITGNFNTNEKSHGGNLIGTGGFGDVFFGQFLGDKVAVKRLKGNDEESLRQFETEVKALCEYKHENLVTLLGFCPDGLTPCLVYEYVINGSLEDRLACLHGSSPLSVPQRLHIATGTAKGIAYLHGKGVTHRDIKSANILLDEEFKPKVSDFATARTLPKAEDKKTRWMQTRAIIGTPAYLDPGAYDHEVHPGLDIYSFGVVILELITGLAVHDTTNRENADLKVHVREHCTPYTPDDDDSDDEETAVKDVEGAGTILDLVDHKPGVVWDPLVVEELYTLSENCLVTRKNRKKIKNVLKKLESLSDSLGDGGEFTSAYLENGSD